MTSISRLTVIGDVPVLEASGEIDLASIGTWRDQLLKAITTHRGTTVVVDLDGVTVLDDAALGVLLGAAGRARESGGDVAVVCTTPRLRQRLASSRLDRAVDVIDSVATLRRPSAT